ncbi:hypothetical protein BLNAU_5537 [Blattamonas nauphoetae]|uniref:Uncharacterized protein n=1 Tax=Blattamonas nauphoetae TaxID=2049346 RepID=A0ABQ9Y6U0_9EUKA|nr:hypothetical protein BLNAU_5537 [Blattamonas nauphoetae]
MLASSFHFSSRVCLLSAYYDIRLIRTAISILTDLVVIVVIVDKESDELANDKHCGNGEWIVRSNQGKGDEPTPTVVELHG